MADRFVIVPTRKWLDPWYRGLSPTERDAWDYVTQPAVETLTGIFEQSIPDMAYLAMIPPRKMRAALNRFASEGRLLNVADVWLMLKWYSVQTRGALLKQSDNRYKPIMRELEIFEQKAPSIVEEWKRLYMALPDEAPSKPLRGNNQAPPKQYQYQDQEQDQEQGGEGGPPSAALPATALPADLTDSERAALAEMKAWRGFTNFNPAASALYLRKLAVDFTGVDVCRIVSDVTAWLDRADKQRERGSHARLRNFCKSEAERIRQRTVSSPVGHTTARTDSEADARPLSERLAERKVYRDPSEDAQ